MADTGAIQVAIIIILFLGFNIFLHSIVEPIINVVGMMPGFSYYPLSL